MSKYASAPFVALLLISVAAAEPPNVTVETTCYRTVFARFLGTVDEAECIETDVTLIGQVFTDCLTGQTSSMSLSISATGYNRCTDHLFLVTNHFTEEHVLVQIAPRLGNGRFFAEMELYNEVEANDASVVIDLDFSAIGPAVQQNSYEVDDSNPGVTIITLSSFTDRPGEPRGSIILTGDSFDDFMVPLETDDCGLQRTRIVTITITQ
ncbi:MAG: hypothetical protein JNG88_11760 [Phycisphaerales bacterium]|nr:hypothetical protein [Phycisphaerales bacterium]